MINLDDIKTIKGCDKSGMLGIIEAFPDQVVRAKEIGTAFELPETLSKKYENIVCTGLGGSAIGGDIARSYLAGSINIPFIVNRNYTLPSFVNNKTLVAVSSYSGNTEETLSAYKDARDKKASILVISSGGEISKMAAADGFTVLEIPSGLPPRCALGYSFFPLIIALSRIGLTKDLARDIDETIKVLSDIKTEMAGSVPESKNSAKKIARELYGKLPVVYAGQDHMDAVATRWRGQIEENSKTLASSQVFPELCHNEIMGWENPEHVIKESRVIILKDKDDHPRVSKRMDIIEKIIKDEKVDVIKVFSRGSSLLARTFSLVYTADFVSFYLAVLNGRDPTSIERIDFLKKELARG